MDLNTELMDIAYKYVSMTKVKSESFATGDVVDILNFTRDITITYAQFVQACNEDHVLVNYYRELATSLDIEDYVKASEYKEIIINYESKV